MAKLFLKKFLDTKNQVKILLTTSTNDASTAASEATPMTAKIYQDSSATAVELQALEKQLKNKVIIVDKLGKIWSVIHG